MHVFFVSSSQNLASKLVKLDEEENHHATKVLRCSVGQKVLLLDGKGNSAEGIFQELHSKESTLIIENYSSHKPLSYQLHMAVAPTKMIDRFEWFLEKATEIGVAEITPIITERTERKVVKMARMEKVVLAAVKQSQQAYFPKINEAIKLKDFLIQQKCSNKFIAHCINAPKEDLITCVNPNSNNLILIGPEGDFTEGEVEKALELGYKAVSLGNSRLRAETAGVVACSQMNSAMIISA